MRAQGRTAVVPPPQPPASSLQPPASSHPSTPPAGEWAKEAAGQPGTHGLLPRSLANLKREISEKKWAEARRWAGGRTSKAKYRMPESQKPDGAVAGSTKRLASRYYQLKTGHARTGQYLHWAKVRPTAQCWWCQCPSQTRDHLFKACPEWRMQQKILWAEVQKETGKWKSRWEIRDLLADGRCGPAVLDFLTSTDVGRLVPPLEKSDTGSQVSEWELRDRREREEEREAGVEELGAAGELDAGEELPLFLPTPPFMASAGEEQGTGRAFLLVCLLFSP